MSDDTPSVCLYFNPRCSTCRGARELLDARGAAVEIVEYLETPPTRDELRALLRKLDMKPEELVRKKEETYRLHYAGRTLSDEEWLDALVAHPILIERPIAVVGERAIVARPLERVLELF